MSDHELLSAYATRGSEEAFTELVRRHVGAVQAAALRQTGNPHLAEEVTHAVFLQLARKAGSIRPSTVLLGWLLRAVRYAAIDALRSEARRQKREAEFMAMHTLDPSPAEAESESLWASVAPLLDDALLRLRERDRNALLLRFFERKNLAAVGAALGVPEDAARKRVQRALERLQHQLEKRGALASAAVLPTLLSSRAAPESGIDLVAATARTALNTGSGSTTSVGMLAAGLGRRWFWAALRPWLAGATAVGLCAGTISLTRSDVFVRLSTEAAEDDYRPAGFPEAMVVRNFVAELQRRLGRDGREDVARMMRYPLRINSREGTVMVNSASELLTRWETILGPKVTAIILKSPQRGLFCDFRGVMVGDGTFWIGPAGDSSHPTPEIIAFNLP